ncbi:MAG: PAS domain S-box protein [Bacteroidales bacterium]|nr:PAS domain S-box protein [Bacteroidales bacterium]MBN2819630.1 PAS domain S-box protein [Bacteroidales bacterium]
MNESFDLLQRGALEQAVNQSTVSIIVTDVKGNIQYVNNAFFEITGFTSDEVLGKNPRILKSGHHTKEFYTDLWDTILSGKTWKGDFYNRRKDGHFYWEAATISPILESNGKINGFVCTKEDITQRKRYELALHESEAKFRSFFVNSNAKIIVVDPKSECIIEANKAAEKFYGYSVNELKALNLKTEFVGLLEAARVEADEKHDDFGNVYAQKHKLKDGRLCDVEIFPTRVSVGNTNMIYIIIQDITRRKRAIEALKESESKKLALLKILPDLIFVLKANGEFVDVYTDQPEKLILPPYQLLGKNIFEVFSKDFSKRLSESISEALISNEIQSFDYHNLSLENKDIHEEIRIISSGDNEVLVIMRDVTAQKNIELELKKAWEEAKEANRSKSVFIANISHEIRTPINAILGFSDLLTSELSERSQLKHLESIKNSSKTLLSLINDLLDLSKVEAGKMDIKLETFQLSSLIEELENIFSLRISEKSFKYIANIQKGVPTTLIFDEIRLRQILINLLSNATKFTEEGEVRMNISASNRITKDNKEYCDLKIEVKDTGIGIKKEYLQEIFEAFKQQDDQDTRKYGGTGLGLTITKRLTELLGGDISVESEFGKGSTFTVNFYQVEISKHIFIEPIPSKKYKVGKIIFKPETILIADDDKFNREFLMGVFKGSNMNFLEAADGEEAIDMVKRHKPKIAFLDIRMPLKDGLAVARFIKTNEEFKEIITLGISATPVDNKTDNRIVFLDGFISKPVNIQVLFPKLEQFLEVVAIANENYNNSQQDSHRLQSSVLLKLKETIVNEIEPAYQRLSNTSSFQEYEKFGKILIKSGMDLKIKQLTYIGSSIIEAVKTFDLDSLSKLVKDYKKIEKRYI